MNEVTNSIAVAVPAATILMLRDGADGLEVFMVVRHHQIDFASGALVFPGGKVAPGDDQVRSRCTSASEDDIEMALQVSAIREAFEECGILLARDAATDNMVTANRLTSLELYRKPLADGAIEIGEFLEQENLLLACDLLHPYAHWITPETMPKRFDTHFYLAAAPPDHVAMHDGHESVDSIWISPELALTGAASGKYTIIFPTRLNVEMLAMSNSVASALKMAGQRRIVSVLPWTEQRSDGNYLCIPEGSGYGISEERIEAIPRK